MTAIKYVPTEADKEKLREEAQGFLKKLGRKLDVKVPETEITISKGGDSEDRYMVMNVTEEQVIELVYQALLKRNEARMVWESQQWRGG